MASKRLSPREFWQTFIGPYRDLYPYLKPYRFRFFLSLGFGALYGVTNGFLAWGIKSVGTHVFPQGKASVAAMHGEGLTLMAAIGVCILIPLIIVARSLCDYLNTYYMAWVSLKVLADIRSQLYEHIIKQSLEFFNREHSGILMSRVTNDTLVAQNALTNISADLIKQPITVLSTLCALIWLDWKFTVISLVVYPLCIIPIAVFGKRVRAQGKNEQMTSGVMMTALQESFAGIRVIKAFAREETEVKKFRKINRDAFNFSIRVRKAIEVVGPLIESLAAIGVGFALFYVWYTHMPAAKFLALMAALFLLYNPAKTLSRIHITMQRCRAATTNIFEILNRTPAIQDREEAIAVTGSKGQLSFENVTFRYRRELPPAIKEVNLQIEPAKFYALVGASGAGKSTILSLLLRFYEPEKGVIRLDGRDLREIKQTSLRERIGIVTQDTFLFHDSILNNIRYGRLEASKEEVIDAAKRAYAHDFIMLQPNGYETVIGDKGCLLSGGQQQRVSIARALLKDAPILLLDEATSALDSEAEREIQAALDRLSVGRTVIAIAHRLSTVLKADRIVVMHHGEIQEMGTHRQLLETSTLYRRLYDLQFNVNVEEELVSAP